MIIQTSLKERALATACAAEDLISLLKGINTKTRDQYETDWLTSAIRTSSQNLEMLQEGLRTIDPKKVEHGAGLLFRMRKLFVDEDLSWTGESTVIAGILDRIQAAAKPVLRSIDRFDPANLAEAKRALQ